MINLPWPPKQLSPNARQHWSTKAKWTKIYRTIAWATARATDWRPHFYDSKAVIDIIFHPPDRRHRDDDNMIGLFKAYRDGLADAWQINDRLFSPHYRIGEPVKGGCIIVTDRGGQ